jgi:hypothetical protein
MEHNKYEVRSHTSYSNSLIESRFKVPLFLYRMGGIPLNKNSVSRVNAVYKVSLTVCFYITTVCLGVDTLVHRHQLTLAMKKLRQFLGLLKITWLHFCVR